LRTYVPLSPTAHAHSHAAEVMRMTDSCTYTTNERAHHTHRYSGYLPVKGVAGQDFMAHYVFVEAETDPETAPMAIWQQGGPGCSGFGAG
jgi:carboxypeptidase C (cathepsin A)